MAEGLWREWGERRGDTRRSGKRRVRSADVNTRCYTGIDRGLWVSGHRALLSLAVRRWTRLYMSRSSRMSLVTFSTAWRTVV